MGLIKAALSNLLAHVYPGDFDAQDELQDRILGGQGLTAAEMELAQGCEAGLAFINSGQVREEHISH